MNKNKVSKEGSQNSAAARALSSDLTGSSNVNLSSKARDMQKAKDVAKAAPDVDVDKVARMKALIAQGNYKVDANAIADRFVDEELALSGIKR